MDILESNNGGRGEKETRNVKEEILFWGEGEKEMEREVRRYRKNR